LLRHPHSYHPVFRTRISAPGHENCTLNLHYELPPLILGCFTHAYLYKYAQAGPLNLELPVLSLGEDDSQNSTFL
ncbi:hypothetical protein R3P38DRAFT_2900941, partial [Favolaschia claudopus]